MDAVFKMAIGAISAIVLLVSGIAVTLGFVDAEASNNYIDSVSKVIAESNFSDEVINECIDEAARNGYELTVAVEGSSRPGSYKYAKLVLKYDFELGFFKIEREKTRSKII